MFTVEIDGVRVLYTGDYSTENERYYYLVYNIL